MLRERMSGRIDSNPIRQMSRKKSAFEECVIGRRSNGRVGCLLSPRGKCNPLCFTQIPIQFRF